MVCGTSASGAWAADPGMTCSTAFGLGTTVEESTKRTNCQKATNTNNKVCPLSDVKWGFPIGYQPWKDKQSSAATIKALAEAAALDAQWFRDVLYQRMYLPVDIKKIKANASDPLHANRVEIENNLVEVKRQLDMYFETQLSKFISFSCMRNIPQCAGSGVGSLKSCQDRCLQVSDAVSGFEAACNTAFNNTVNGTKLSFVGGKPSLESDNQIFACRPLGYMKNGQYITYERDCLGDNPTAEYPGLCSEFQNDEIRKRQMARGNSALTAAPSAILVAMATAVAFLGL
jgi:hypothetical protein